MVEEGKKGPQPKLGEVLVEYGIITSDMLKNGLRRQAQVGGQIGSILIEMGYVTADTLLEFMSKKFGVPSVNLIDVDVPKKVLDTLPLEKMREYNVLPVEDGEKYILAMVNPHDYVAIKDIEFIAGRIVNPVIVPAAQIKVAIDLAASGIDIKGSDIRKRLEKSLETASDIKLLLNKLIESEASDLQLTAGVPPSLKLNTELHRLHMPALTPQDTYLYVQALMTGAQLEKFEKESDLEFAFIDDEKGRFRVSAYKQRNSVSITIRRIPDSIPSLHELGLPADLENYALKPQGLILVTSPSGQGKSTTVAAMVDIINTKRKCNIITLEEPIEFLHKHKNSNVNQREVGIDISSYQKGLKHIFRQDPDVVVIGELRDLEGFKVALQIADSGHLVLSTFNSKSATSPIERVIDSFPPHQQQQIRNQIADCLVLVLSQRLVPRRDGSGLVAAYEKFVNTVRMKNYIREGKLHQIRAQVQLHGDDYVSIDSCLAGLCIKGMISFDEGEMHADNDSIYRGIVTGRGIK